MFTPENELGVIVLFSRICDSYGLIIETIGAKYPDAILRDITSQQPIRAEFEYVASNFLDHGHEPRFCDLVICWKNDLPEFPLPVFEVASPDGFEFKPISEVEKELIYLRLQNKRLMLEVNRLKPNQKRKKSKATSPVATLYPPPGDGWRIEINRGKYYIWRRGSRNSREHIYGGRLQDMPEEVREKYYQ